MRYACPNFGEPHKQSSVYGLTRSKKRRGGTRMLNDMYRDAKWRYGHDVRY